MMTPERQEQMKDLYLQVLDMMTGTEPGKLDTEFLWRAIVAAFLTLGVSKEDFVASVAATIGAWDHMKAVFDQQPPPQDG